MGAKEIERLQAEYDALCATLAPQLGELANRGDEHATRMRQFFGEARAAWDNGDGAGAKALSEQGRSAQARSEAANREAAELRSRERDAYSGLAAARHTYLSSPIVYGTHLIGFEKTRGWSAAKVQEFLKHLPERAFADIDAIEHRDIVDTKGRAGVTEDLHDHGHKANIVIFRPRIDLTGKDFNRYQAWTLVHEYGHVVLDRTLPELRHSWKDFHNARLAMPGVHWITPTAGLSAREDFAESFAAYLLKPSSLSRDDPEKYEIMKSIYESL